VASLRSGQNPRQGSRSASRVLMPVYILACVVIAIFAGSNWYVLHSASAVAVDVRKGVERKLLRNEIARQIDILSQDQSQISHWDEAVEALGKQIDEGFLREKVANWLWEDFGVQYSIIVSPEHGSRAVVFEHKLLDAEHGQAIVDQNRDLIVEAQKKYMRHRIAHGDGFKLAAHPVRSEKPIHINGIRRIDGQLGFVAVQAIVPHEHARLGDGLPQTLLTFKPLRDAEIIRIGSKLGLPDLAVLPAGGKAVYDETLLLPDDGDRNHFAAGWNVASPRKSIWDRTTAIIMTLLIGVTAALIYMTLRHGRTLLTLHRSEEANRFLAMHDPLTGLANRLQFAQKIEEFFETRKSGCLTVLCIDLDRFKAVNDTHGHKAGDMVIQEAARRIQNVVANHGLVARIGGDEFIALLWDDLDPDHVQWLADSMIEEVSKDIRIEEGVARIGASIGIAYRPGDAMTADSLVQCADRALYDAKEQGRGKACFFNPREPSGTHPLAPGRTVAA